MPEYNEDYGGGFRGDSSSVPFPDLGASVGDLVQTLALGSNSYIGKGLYNFGQDTGKFDIDKFLDFSGTAPITGSKTYGGNAPVDTSWQGTSSGVNNFGQEPTGDGNGGSGLTKLAGQALDFLGTNSGKNILSAGLSGLSQAAKDKNALEIAQMAIDFKKKQQDDMNNSVKSYTGIIGNVLKNKG